MERERERDWNCRCSTGGTRCSCCSAAPRQRSSWPAMPWRSSSGVVASAWHMYGVSKPLTINNVSWDYHGNILLLYMGEIWDYVIKYLEYLGNILGNLSIFIFIIPNTLNLLGFRDEYVGFHWISWGFHCKKITLFMGKSTI